MIEFTDEERTTLLANALVEADRVPVVRLFTPWAGATWLLTELDPECPTIAFGLCDLGLGSPELGYVSLDEINSISGPGGLKIEKDLHFRPDKTIAEYAELAHHAGRIVT